MLSDLRQTVRSLSQARAFSLAVILTLGLGVGLNAAVFSAIHGVLLRPLAFPAPDRLYTIWQDMTARGATRQEYGGKSVFTDWRARNHSFAAMAAFFRQPMDLSSIDPRAAWSGPWCLPNTSRCWASARCWAAASSRRRRRRARTRWSSCPMSCGSAALAATRPRGEEGRR